MSGAEITGGDKSAIVPSALMVELESLLCLQWARSEQFSGELSDEQGQALWDQLLWAARQLDRQVRRRRPIREWARWLEQVRGPEQATPEKRGRRDSVRPDVVRNLFEKGAERTVYEELVFGDEQLRLEITKKWLETLHDLVHDPSALRLLVDLEEAKAKEGLKRELDRAVQAAGCLVNLSQAEGRQANHVGRPADRATAAAGSPADQMATGVVGKAATNLATSGRDQDVRRLQGLVRQALFDLLSEAGFQLPEGSEAEAATQLFVALAGDEAIRTFKELRTWVDAVRKRLVGGSDQEQASLVKKLAPEIFEKTRGGSHRYAVSYRLWIRERLKELYDKTQREQGKEWAEAMGERGKLAKLRRLSRERIGELLCTRLDEARAASGGSAEAEKWLQESGVSLSALSESCSLLLQP